MTKQKKEQRIVSKCASVGYDHFSIFQTPFFFRNTMHRLRTILKKLTNFHFAKRYKNNYKKKTEIQRNVQFVRICINFFDFLFWKLLQEILKTETQNYLSNFCISSRWKIDKNLIKCKKKLSPVLFKIKTLKIISEQSRNVRSSKITIWTSYAKCEWIWSFFTWVQQVLGVEMTVDEKSASASMHFACISNK